MKYCEQTFALYVDMVYNRIDMRTILHCDANNFYASVECALNPGLVDKFVAVSGDPEKRHGIILAKNTAAKACGVKTGDVIWEAKRKCPQLICVPPHFDKYVEYSRRIFEVYTQYTDRVEPFGIDECWLDVTQSYRLYGSGEKIAEELRERIKREVGVTVSIGVSFTKVFAKLGSDMKKPDAVTVISPENFRKKIWGLDASEMLMVGRRTAAKLAKVGIHTIGDLANADKRVLHDLLGVNGDKLSAEARGEGSDDVRLSYETDDPKSIGHSTTLPRDVSTREEVESVVMALSEMVAARLRKHGFVGRGIAVGIKYNDLSGEGKQRVIAAVDNAVAIAREAMITIEKMYSFGEDAPIRALSVSLYDLCKDDAAVQTSMFDQNTDKEHRLGKTLDKIRGKYGFCSIRSASVLANAPLCEGLVDSDFKPFERDHTA